MKRLLKISFSGIDALGASSGALEFVSADEFPTGIVAPASDAGDERVRSLGEIRNVMFTGNALRGAMEISPISITLANEDGALDYLDDYAFDGSLCTVTDLMAGTDTIATVALEQPLLDEKTITFAGRDYRHKFDVPLLTNRYAGTNAGAPLAGIEGTASDIKGKPKPRVLGSNYNISPILVNTDKYIYQIDGHDGLNTGWFMTVFDKRGPLTAGADYVSQADMETNVPAAGQYRVWPAGGCFRIGTAPPVGQITADVHNPPKDVSAGYPTYPPTTLNALSTICRYIAYLGDNTLALDGSGNNRAAKQFWSQNPSGGVYFTEDITVLSALERVLASINGYVTNGPYPTATTTGAGTSGVYFGQLLDPASLPYTPGLAAIDLGEDTIEADTFLQVSADDATRGLPVWRVNLNWKRVYTVMGEADLAGVAAADKEFVKREYRTVNASDATVKTQWPNAIEFTVDTLLTTESEAQTECDRLLALLKVKRRMYQLTVRGDAIRQQSQFTAAGATVKPSMFQVGSRVRITHPRFGLSSGVLFTVISMGIDPVEDLYHLVVWG